MQGRHLFILLAFALFASPLAAQETTGKIQGRVVDAQSLAVPGATVTATGVQGSKNTMTDGDGRYTIPFLTPGVYSVRAELQGFKAIEQKEVSVRARPDGRRAPQARSRRRCGGRAGDRRGARRRHLVHDDRRRHQHGRPAVDSGRPPRCSDTLYLSPGVSSSGTLGRANPSISGGSGLENQYVVDGANVTNTGYGGLGSYSIIFGSLGNATPYDFIKEIQVKTGGYEAEFGQATGGVVNVITKSGTNQFRGSVFAYTAAERSRERLDAVPGDERFGEHGVHEDQRRRRRGRRSARQGPRVLLRRDRPGLADADASPRRRTSRSRASARFRATARRLRTPRRGPFS